MEIRSLKDIATTIRTGKTPPTKEEKYFNGKINWYSPSDLDKTKYLLHAKRTITNEAIQDKKAITFPKDTLLIGCIGDIGKLGITSEVSSSNQQITGILPNDQTNVSYLFYWFKGNKKVLENYSNNAVVPILNNTTLKTIKIPLPPLDQQKKIAAILDAADAYRQKTKALIEKYEELTQSLFLDMFGDPVSNPKGFNFPKLKEVCKVSQGMQIAIKHRHKESGPNRYKYLTVAYLNGRKDEEFIENPRSSVICNNEDILMTRTGNTGQVITNVEGVFHNNFFKVEWSRDKLNKIYFAAFLLHSKIKQELLKRASTTTIPDLNHGQFYDLNVIVPSKEMQNKFAERVQEIEEQKAQAEASLAHAEDLFNSLLQRAFKGELTS